MGRLIISENRVLIPSKMRFVPLLLILYPRDYVWRPIHVMACVGNSIHGYT